MQMAGLNLATAEGFQKGSDSGPLVNPANPESSRLLQVLAYTGTVKMPPTGKLSDTELAAFRDWVKDGALFPASESPASKPNAPKTLWSFQPIRKQNPPSVRRTDWVRNEIDHFILAKLEEKGLPPAPQATKLTLLRRVTFDLTGLPPTESEIADFLKDESPAAFERVVDRLLASPRYGERWGRHWLDIARYADSTGLDEDHRYPHAWRYRDYVIESFNLDVPYNQFVKEQLAGDLIATESEGAVNPRGLIATGFLALGPKPIAQQDKQRLLYDVVDEQIDTVSKAFLGITVACARCHDHKFDPISTRDYYSMAAIFASTRSFNALESFVSEMYTVPLVPQGEYDTWRQQKKQIEDKEKELAIEKRRWIGERSVRLVDFLTAATRVAVHGEKAAKAAKETGVPLEQLPAWIAFLKENREAQAIAPLWRSNKKDVRKAAVELQAPFLAALADPGRPVAESLLGLLVKKGGPLAPPDEPDTPRARELVRAIAELKRALPPEPAMANGVGEGTPIHQRVFLRGNHLNPGEYVPKAVPAALAGNAQPVFRTASGRKELAEWLTDPAHPLTARVIVNRIWQWHFGEGIVRTPSNWGATGANPTHPELLDWLAERFIADGWSFKKMHKRILLSATWQQSVASTPFKLEKDPANEWLSRFPRRRLSVEEMRDAMLALDGALDLTMGGTLQTGRGTDGENDPKRMSIDPALSKRRTVYIPLRRSNLPALLNLFDFGDATTSNEMRTRTNVAPQALFVMNSPFVAERARNLAERVKAETQSNGARIEKLYLKVYGRPPAPAEIDEALAYLQSGKVPDPWMSYARILLASNEFWYVD